MTDCIGRPFATIPGASRVYEAVLGLELCLHAFDALTKLTFDVERVLADHPDNGTDILRQYLCYMTSACPAV